MKEYQRHLLRIVSLLILKPLLALVTFIFRFFDNGDESAELAAMKFAFGSFTSVSKALISGNNKLFAIRVMVASGITCRFFWTGEKVKRLPYKDADDSPVPLYAYRVCAETVKSQSKTNDVVIMHIHGGGFVAGDGAFYINYVNQLGMFTGLRGYAINYRLAPENDLSCCLDDCVAAYIALASGEMDPSNPPPSKIIISGDSAGGGLVLGCLQKLKTMDLNDLVRPSAAVMLSPWLDLTMSSSSITKNDGKDPIATADFMKVCISLALGTKNSAKDPRFSFLFGDMSGLPPCFICASEVELLADDTKTFVEEAKIAGNVVETSYHPTAIHTYPLVVDYVPEFAPTLHEICRFIKTQASA